MCLQHIKVGDVFKLCLDRNTPCIKSQLSNRRPYPSSGVASVIKIELTKWLKFSMGIKYMTVQEPGHWHHEVERASPEDVHISNFPLNANAHGRF